MKQIVLIYIFSTLIDGRYKTTQNKYIYKSFIIIFYYFFILREERRRRRGGGEKREEERESERVFLFVVGHWSL
jgi:hypothetical protein